VLRGGALASRLANVVALLGLLALVIAPPGLAEEFSTPAIAVSHPDWRAVMDQLRSELNAVPGAASGVRLSSQRGPSASGPRSNPALVQLNAVTSALFTGVGRSPVPVLLPLDTAAYLAARDNGSIPDGAAPTPFQADFRTDAFDAGPAGYDAIFSLPPDVGAGLPARGYVRPVEVQITGSLLIYDVFDSNGGKEDPFKGEPAKALATQYPNLRRFIREGYVRYAFTRFGIPYVVSIQCLDSAPRPRRLACREAYPVAERFLKALHVAGGLPARQRPDIAPQALERPDSLSAEFSYRPTGDIIANSGARHQGGRIDRTAYSQIRFPLDAPAYVHSQSFSKRHSSDPSDQPAGQYPWRDNFCEARSFNVGQCASGFGHQGEDIRPGACPAAQREGREACDPRQQRVLAVRDGVVLRAPKEQAATLQVNSGTEHIRFRYMHMNPATMDADGLLNGRALAEGEQIGVVSNYLDHPNGTSRHLHFDVQVFTRDGWIWVNPYVTLISAYERSIRGRGRETVPEVASSPAVMLVPAVIDDPVRYDQPEGNAN